MSNSQTDAYISQEIQTVPKYAVQRINKRKLSLFPADQKTDEKLSKKFLNLNDTFSRKRNEMSTFSEKNRGNCAA